MQSTRARPPIHEPDLPDLVQSHGGNRFTATTEYDVARETDLTILALPTPSKEDGHIDTSIIEAGAAALDEALAQKDEDHVVVTKSTVVPTTTTETLAPMLVEASGKTLDEDLHVGMNPEFLREGSAVSDFRNPDKLVFGTKIEPALEALYTVFDPIIDDGAVPIVETAISEAEMIKYANNAFLASKVSLINDLGNICKEYDIDAYDVADAIGLDDRISPQFLRSGPGRGGSCFGKDVAAISAAAREQGYEPAMLNAAVQVNDRQPDRLLALMDQHTDVRNGRVAVLGLSFKPGTDDIRKSRAIPVIRGLRDRDADIIAFDPVSSENMRELFPDIDYVEEPATALEDSVAALIVTDWPEITSLDQEFDRMHTPVVIDGRHAIDRREAIVYEGLTW